MIGLLLWGFAGAAQAVADPSPSLSTCQLRAGSQIVLDLADLPPSILTSLEKNVPGLAPRDTRFQRDDVIREPALPKRRFIGAVASRGMWVVIYERGILYQTYALTFAARGTGSSKDRDFSLVPYANLAGPICSLLSASFSGVRAANPSQL